MATPKEHIEEIRRKKFFIGGKEPNPLIEDLHHAVMNLSSELYAKDVHFLMELIQNAEDNQYLEGVDPTLEFILTSKDITGTGAPATLLIYNNEKGFSPRNIDSICGVGRSTKKGNRINGYIGEKGIGFKSVFLISRRPYVFSNGYQIRFNEDPCSHCGLGYIVPEWVDENPTLAAVKQIYGARGTLPTTTIVLPLKPDKVKAVKQQLSSIHGEVLLFLSKIKRLSVRENNENPKHNTISAVAISSEINFMTRKNINAESYTLHLSEEENGDSGKECGYYMWQQKFPVRPEHRVQRRMDVQEWVVTLAFPNHERLQRGKTLPGVYAFLPTEMVTNFPFIIQADFVLASSRETILLDDKWNQGILDCVSTAFMGAFKSLVIATDTAPVSSLPRMFQFLPVNSSAYEELNTVRDKIKAMLLQERIVPIETYKQQKHFYKPGEVGRLMPAFWDILTEASEQGVYLHNLSSHGRYILSSSFDKDSYDQILNFLRVKPVDNEWYAKCIQSSNLVEGVSEDVYLKLLLFIAKPRFSHSSMMNIPLIKYVGSDGNMSHFSLNECTQNQGAKRIFLADQNHSHLISWLIDWNKEFRCASNCYFMPETTQQAIWEFFPKRQSLVEWLSQKVNVSIVNVYSFANLLCKSIKNNRRLAITYAHFLYHSFSKDYLTPHEVVDLCGSMPLVDNYGHVTASRVGVLVPASLSKWADLAVSNPWRNDGYVELGEDYLRPCCFAGQITRQQDLSEFLKFLATYARASDIPQVAAPNAGISGVDTPLTKENAFLLLNWIRNLKCRETLPERFLKCIKEGSWLKVTANGYRAPSQSFLIGSKLGDILKNGSVLVDIALVDQDFYGDQIWKYKEELKTVGVMFEYGEACQFIGKQLMSQAASLNLSKGHLLLILAFIQYLRKSLLPADEFVNSIKGESWLKTSHGYRSPVGSILHESEWKTASQIIDIPFIDQAYYGGEIYNFKEELKLLGVIVGFSGNHQLVIDHLKSPLHLTSLTAEVVVLMLECMRHVDDPGKLVNALQGTNCLKTNNGFKTPGECFLRDPVWGCILDVFSGFPVIDHEFYGVKILNYKKELKQTGVVVDFEEAIKAFGGVFKQKASQPPFNSYVAVLLLSCFRQLKETEYQFPAYFLDILRTSKWLRTRIGDYRSPGECILYGTDWKSLSPITRLPFIDDSDNCYGTHAHKYKEELKSMGVITELEHGVKFVLSSLSFPDPSSITPENVFSLLECIRLLLKSNHPLKADFKKSLSKSWLMTHAGYRSPDKCLLFGSKWKKFLKPKDGPFIDKGFYGPKIALYNKELIAIGVVFDDVDKGCSLIASSLDFHSEYSTIVRIYRCLDEYDWKSDKEAAKRVWVPKGDDNGEWVNSEECVFHDKDDLFGSKLHVLENHYDKALLSFFSSAMSVRNSPSLDDYIELWKEWESSVEQLSHDKCHKFWTSVLQRKSKKTEKNLAESLMKLPAASRADGILLLDKRDVFVADNLHLKNLFEQERVFVWCPDSILTSLQRSKLLDLYKNIGVRTISESVQKEESSLLDGVKLTQVEPRNVFIGKVLVKLILGFLACSSLKMEAERRHEAVQGLLDLTVYETTEPVTVSYSLSLSSGDIITRKSNRMIRWDRESSKFFSQKMDWRSGNACMTKYAIYFSEAISVGVLRENDDHVLALSELIKFAFLLKFDEEAVDILMESKDLQIFLEDEEFLSAAFSAD